MRISDWSSDVCSSDLRYSGLILKPYFPRPGKGELAGERLPVLAGLGEIGGHRLHRLQMGGDGGELRLGGGLRQRRRMREDAKGRRKRERRCKCKDSEVFHRSEEHTSELQSLMRISYAVFCLKKKKTHIDS